MPHPGTVEAELFAQLDDLQGGLVTGSWISPVEQADGEKAQLGQRLGGYGHRDSLLRPCGILPDVDGAPVQGTAGNLPASS